MPYKGMDPELTDKMDSCVKKVMAEGNSDKDSAIAICRKRIEGSVTFTGNAQFEIVEDPSDLNMVLGQKFEKGELLRWRDAELARAEVNANRDELDNGNVQDLAGTLPLMPLTDEHGHVIGLFTAAEASPDPEAEDVMRLITEGVMYARRFPETADEIQHGTKRLSVEAMADQALCSICGSEFENSATYCEHLQNRHTSGATRRFKGIRAVGGGAVRRPAGSKAGFNVSQVYMVASHQEPLDDGQVNWDAELHWKIIASAISDEESHRIVTQKLGYLANVSRDPETVIKAKSILKMLQGQFGNISEGGSMELEQVQKQLDEALAKLEAANKAGDELRESNTELQASLSTAEGQVEEFRAANEQLEVARKKQERKLVLASVMSDEEFAENETVIMAMSDEAVQLMVDKAKPEAGPPKTPTTVTAGLEGDDDTDSYTLA